MSEITPEIIEAARLAVTRDICRREGHHWFAVGTLGELPWTRDMCRRGCGAEHLGIHHGAGASTGTVIDKLGRLDPARTVVRGIEIVVEPADIAKEPTNG